MRVAKCRVTRVTIYSQFASSCRVFLGGGDTYRIAYLFVDVQPNIAMGVIGMDCFGVGWIGMGLSSMHNDL